MTLDKLDEALSNLERRIGIDPSGRRAHGPLHRDDDISAIRARQEALARNDVYATPSRPAPRGGYAATPQMAAEPAGLRAEMARLREELNREMSTTIAGQFEGIRDEIRSLWHQAGSASAEDIADGFGRVSRELGVVASRVEASDMGAMRAEVEELKNHVLALAREDTLRDMADRWSVVEREISALPQLLGSRKDLNAVSERMADMDQALRSLPDSRSIGAMEDQLRALAEAVESIAGHNAAIAPAHLRAIEDRLDEITRAIVSVSVSAAPPELDTTPFERIEARLSSLARQVEDRRDAEQSESVERRLAEIAARLDELQDSATDSGSSRAFEAVAMRLDDIVRRIESTPAGEAGAMPGDLDQRLDSIAARLDAANSSAEERGQHLFQSLDQRMEDLARRIDENERDAGPMPTFDHMERRIEEIAQMLSAGEGFAPYQGGQPDLDVIGGLEAQIAALSEKLSSVALPHADHSPLAELAPRLAEISEQLTSGREDMITIARETAEEVIARYSHGATEGQKAMLGDLAGDLRMLETLSRDSDDRNMRTFEAIHDTLIKVAERIAGLEDSLRYGAFAPQADVEPETEREPAPRSAEPAMARPVRQPAKPASAMTHVEDAPSLDFAASEPEPAMVQTHRVPSAGISPAEAAAMAARAALDRELTSDEDRDIEQSFAARETAERKGLLSGLRSAIMRNAPDEGATPAGDAEPPLFGQTSREDNEAAAAAKLQDEPLEPGSGAPDLAEIMKRVRAERADAPLQGTAQDSSADDAGKSDFIAAARRAARAAAADISVSEKSTAGKETRARAAKPGKAAKAGKAEKVAKSGEAAKGGKSVLAANRRPLMLAAGAVLLALMAYPLARGYLERGGSPADVADVETIDPVITDTGGNAADRAADGMDLMAPAASDGVAPVGPVRVVEAAKDNSADGDAPMAKAFDAGAEAAMKAPTMTAPALTTPPMTTPGTLTASVDMSPEPAVNAGFQKVTLSDVPETAGPVALREAAAAGDPKALFVVGDRLLGKGPGAPDSDLKGAARWFEMAAEMDFAPAQYRIGNAYEKGLGVERDAARAKEWYARAAEAGNVSAMHNLAVLHATEIDGERDMQEAARWFMEAADHGVTDSQVNLGILSARGEGLAQDLSESWKWLSLAAKAGDKDAAAKRDEVAGFMRPDQMKTARDAVDLWKVKPVDPAANAVDVPDAWTTGKEMTAAAPISPDAMKKAIRNIQGILNQNGYDAGPADGLMGSRTRQAIVDFQKANGLLPTGEVDRALVNKLLEVNKQG